MAVTEFGFDHGDAERVSVRVAKTARGLKFRTAKNPSLIARSLRFAYTLLRGKGVLQLDREQRILSYTRTTPMGRCVLRQSLRYEELVRFELAYSSNLRGMLFGSGHWNNAKIRVHTAVKTLCVLRGEMSELEQIIEQLRRETGAT